MKICEDFSIEVNDKILEDVEKLQETIAKDDVYLYMLVMLVMSDKLMNTLWEENEPMVQKMLQDDGIENFVAMICRLSELLWEED